ncbi:MAG: hypothetical protein ACFFAE_08925 [Candidatus Hodarchaeota archaeon]
MKKNKLISGMIGVLVLISLISITPVQAYTTSKTYTLYTDTELAGKRYFKLKAYVDYVYQDHSYHITGSRLELFSTTSGAPPGIGWFQVDYISDEGYWKIWSPTVYDDGIMTIGDGPYDEEDNDEFVGISLYPDKMKLNYYWYKDSYPPAIPWEASGSGWIQYNAETKVWSNG